MFKKSLICSVVFHFLLCAGLELVLDPPVHLSVGQQSTLVMVALDVDTPLETKFSKESAPRNGGQRKSLNPLDKSLLKDQQEQSMDLDVAEETPPPLLTNNDKINPKIAMIEPGKSEVKAEGTQNSDFQGSEMAEEETFSDFSPPSPGAGLPDQLPVKLRHRTPKYPLIAHHNNWEGVTVLVIQIQPDGRVGEVDVSQSSGYRVLDEAAAKAVKHWRYQPALKNGVAIAWQIRVRIKFVLE